MAIVIVVVVNTPPVRVQATVRPLLLAERQEEYEAHVPTCPKCGLRELHFVGAIVCCECGYLGYANSTGWYSTCNGSLYDGPFTTKQEARDSADAANEEDKHEYHEDRDLPEYGITFQK